MFKKTMLIIISAALVAVAASGCDTGSSGKPSKTSSSQATSEETSGQASEGGNSSEMPDDNGSEVTDDTSSAEAETSDSGVTPTQSIIGFGDLPSSYSYYAGAMSAPKSFLTISSDGAFHVEWKQLTPQSETDSETGEDRSRSEMNGTLTPLEKTDEDYCYTCKVASSDSNDYPAGQTVTFLLPGAPVSALPDKHYPEVIAGYENDTLTAAHVYFELQDSVYVATPN